MTASYACLNLIKEFEALRLEAYTDACGIPTIGYGHTAGVKLGQRIDEPTADQFLRNDVAYIESQLASLLGYRAFLTQGEWDALVSLCFNLAGGPRALPHKAPRLWYALCTNAKDKAAHEFLDMDHALVGGAWVELPGLKRRREAEVQLFLS